MSCIVLHFSAFVGIDMMIKHGYLLSDRCTLHMRLQFRRRIPWRLVGEICIVHHIITGSVGSDPLEYMRLLTLRCQHSFYNSTPSLLVVFHAMALTNILKYPRSFILLLP